MIWIYNKLNEKFMSNFVAHTSYKYAKFDSQTKKFLFCLLSVKIGSGIAEDCIN